MGEAEGLGPASGTRRRDPPPDAPGRPIVVDLDIDDLIAQSDGVILASRRLRAEVRDLRVHTARTRPGGHDTRVRRVRRRSGRLIPLRGGSGALDGARVVVVTDDPDQRDLLILLLKWFGAVSITAAAVDTAVVAAWFRPDIVLMELPFDRRPALEMAATLRRDRDAAVAGPRLIALTRHPHEHLARDTVQAGFDMQIAVPVEPEDFERRLVAALPRPR